jgi:hypothetical protein
MNIFSPLTSGITFERPSISAEKRIKYSPLNE